MDKSTIIKERILSEYKSVREFATVMNIPYSTLSSALDGKIEGMAYGTVLKMCEKLDLNPIDLTPIDSVELVSRKMYDKKLTGRFNLLNKDGQKKVLDYMSDLLHIDKYIKGADVQA